MQRVSDEGGVRIDRVEDRIAIIIVSIHGLNHPRRLALLCLWGVVVVVVGAAAVDVVVVAVIIAAVDVVMMVCVGRGEAL